MGRRFMRTRFAGSHRRTSAAIESVVEKQWRNTQLFRFKFIEDVMRVVSSVVVAHARMIATYDEMRAAVVLANQRMKHRFARAGVAHCGRHDRKDRARCRVVSGEYGFIR